MRKILLLSVLLVVIIAGCAQQEPTGSFLVNQKGIEECIQSWNCTDWSDCMRNGTDNGIQNRTCIDENNCNNGTNKPYDSRVCGLPKTSSKDPAQMALEISDLPNSSNWTVRDRNILSKEEATQIERDLGFKKGFLINYFSQSKDNNVEVYHIISIYPMVDSIINMTYSFDAVRENYKTGDLYENTNEKITSVSALPDPFAGEYSMAYNITLTSESVYTIAFTKWDVAEVIKLKGNKIDYSLLTDIAKKAEVKIA
jgi:uncharacterized lipoprotein YehR (DUF1307 family)